MITPDEQRLWDRRTEWNRAGQEAMLDPLWRLRWLYSITDRHGRRIKFTPTAEQVEVIIALHVRGWRRIIIPKARQLGMSTVLCLIGLDLALFNAGFKAALVDKKGDDAAAKMREKVRAAWEALPDELRAQYMHPPGYDLGDRLGFRLRGTTEVPSCYEAGITFRGGTCQLLHISEWGWIQANDPARSKEILTGSLPAAEQGIIVVETTWEGGKGGDLWPFVQESLATPEAARGPDSWRVLFFGWWTCPGYATSHGFEDEDTRRLLDHHARTTGLHFTREQRLWYAEKRRRLRRHVFGEFPTTLEECWHSPVAGAIYGDEMDRLRTAGRVGREFSLLRELPLYTFWDLGMSDSTVLLLVQFAGTEVHVLDHHEAEGQPASYYADHLHRWESEHGRAISRHYLPHDAGRRSLNDATSYQDTLARLGFRNTEVIPASHDVWWGINLLRDLLPRCVFHARCLRPWKDSTEKERLSLVQCLEAYRKRPGGGPGGVIHEEPVHDAASHSADAMRMIAEARTRGLIPALDPAARHADRPPRRSVKMHVGG